jgi:hypothetical protein
VISWSYEVWHCLHERRDEAERIARAIQELVAEYVRSSGSRQMFPALQTRWERNTRKDSMRLRPSFVWLESYAFPCQGVVLHLPIRCFRDLSINNTGLIKSSEILPSLVLSRTDDCQEFVWHPYPCCQLCVVQFVTDPTNILDDKAHKVRHPPQHYRCRNVRSLRYVAH